MAEMPIKFYAEIIGDGTSSSFSIDLSVAPISFSQMTQISGNVLSPLFSLARPAPISVNSLSAYGPQGNQYFLASGSLNRSILTITLTPTGTNTTPLAAGAIGQVNGVLVY